LYATSGSITRTVTTLLTVPATSIFLSTVNLTFGSVQISTTGPSQTFTITNIGKSYVGITSIVSSSNSFPQTNNCGSGLSAGKVCTVTVTFTPLGTGSLTATLTITDNDLTSPQIVNVSGTGLAAPSLSFTPSPAAFPDTEVGYTSAPLVVTITNTSASNAAPLSLTSIAVTGNKASDYLITADSCPISPNTLAAGASCNVTMTFTPGASGSRNANLTVTDNTGGNNQDVDSITGNGVLPTTTMTPSSLSFASQIVGTTSPGMTFTYINSSSSAVLTISSIALTGAKPGDYAQTNNCPSSLAAGASCTFTVTFTPTGTGNRNANVTVYNNTSYGSDNIPLTGSGAYPTVSFSPSPLAFGNQQIGYTSPSQTVTLTNTSAVPLTISSVTLTGSYPGDYKFTNNCSTTVAAGASCTVTISFTPGASGNRNATLTVYDNVSSGTSSESLTGAGVYPTASLSPGTLAFGNQEVAYKSAGITATLTNTSSWTLTVSSITLTGSKPGDYSETNTCPATLASNGTCTITVWFTPAKSGTRDATLTVNDNASGGTTTAALTGTGVLPSATVSPSSDNFGSVTKGTTSGGMASTLTNNSTNGSVLSISSIAVTGTNKSDYSQTNTCGATLAVNASCTVTVKFTPSAKGTRTANITITDNVSAGDQTISLTGTGK
jgi:hypothetical protein